MSLAAELSSDLASNLAGDLGGSITASQVLAPILLANWDSRVGATTAAWVERVAGRSLSATLGAVIVAPDGNNFRGQPVVVFDGQTGSGLFSGGGGVSPVMALNGLKPWVGVVMRVVTTALANNIVMHLGNASFANNPRFELYSTTGGVRGDINGVTIATAGSALTPSFYELQLDGATPTASMRRDGAVLGSSAGAVFAGDLTRVELGRLSFTANNSICNIAQILVCSQAPSAAMLASLYPAIRRDWGTP